MKIMIKWADQKFKAMADQTFQVFESITYSLVFLIIIMIFNRFYTVDEQKEEKKDKIRDLKLEAQQVK